MKAVCVIGMTNGALKQCKHIINAVTDTLLELGLEVTNFNIIECGLPYFEEGTTAENYEKMATFMSGAKNIILAFNVFDYAPSAPMKIFLEHAANGTLFENKNIFLISIDKSTGEKEAADYVSRVVSRHGGIEVVRVAVGGGALRAINSGSIPIAAIEKYAEDYFRLIKQNRVFIRSGEYIGHFPPYVSKDVQTAAAPTAIADGYNPVSAEIKGLKTHMDGKGQGALQNPIPDILSQKSKVQDIIAHDAAPVKQPSAEQAQKKESLLDFDIFNARQEEDIEELTKLFATKLKGDENAFRQVDKPGYPEQGGKEQGAYSQPKPVSNNPPLDKNALSGAIPSFSEYQAGASFKDDFGYSATMPTQPQNTNNQNAGYMQNDVKQNPYTNMEPPAFTPTQTGQSSAHSSNYQNEPPGYAPNYGQPHANERSYDNFNNYGPSEAPRQWDDNQRYSPNNLNQGGYNYPQDQRHNPYEDRQITKPPQFNENQQSFYGDNYNYTGDPTAGMFGYNAEPGQSMAGRGAQMETRQAPPETGGLYTGPAQTFTESAAPWQQKAQQPFNDGANRGAAQNSGGASFTSGFSKDTAPITARTKTCKQMTQNLVHYFQPQIAQDTEAIFQFNITGEEQFSGYLTIKNRDNEYYDGINDAADITILADSAIWVNVLKGKYTAQKAFMTGQLKVRGNFMLLNRFDQMYKKM